jgi:hypothetical protein
LREIRNKKGGPREIKYFRSISAGARSSNSDTKEHVFDMPIFLNHGSTSRPPGEYHLRHFFKEITDNLEYPYPPFDIFSIETSNIVIIIIIIFIITMVDVETD